MKNLIDITSDIHSENIFRKKKNIFGKNGVLTQKNDYLIIAGDINSSISGIEKSFDDIIENTSYKKIIVTFGNHDIRLKDSEKKKYNLYNSIDKYKFLIDYFHLYKNIIHVIDKEDFFIPDTKYIITGNMGWYNYTINEIDKFYLEKFYKVDFDKMSFGSVIFNDKYNIIFDEKIVSNIDFSTYLENDLIKKLQQLKSHYNSYELIVVSHVKPNIRLEKDSQYHITYNNDMWEEIIKEGSNGVEKYGIEKIYGNAFFVNNNLGKIYEKYGIKYVIYGHTHYNGDEEINGVNYITNAFGYY